MARSPPANKHAARHLLECQSLVAGIQDFAGFEGARRLRQPPPGSTWPEGWLLEPIKRGKRPTLTTSPEHLPLSHSLQLRGHVGPLSPMGSRKKGKLLHPSHSSATLILEIVRLINSGEYNSISYNLENQVAWRLRDYSA